MRVFIAVDVPADVKDRIAALIEELKQSSAAVKWVDQENLHVTLKFLGEIEEVKLDKLIEETKKAVSGSGGFTVRFKGLGTFPEGRHPKVVWVGTAEGGDRLCQLAEQVKAEDFVPHLTIGRVKDNKGDDTLINKVRSLMSSELGVAKIDTIKIMKSTLTPQGPIYETVHTCNL